MIKIPMNLPNRITIVRILLIPVYLLLLTLYKRPVNWPAAVVFGAAAGTDWVDGYLARKRDEITDFGKFMDPIADKLLILLPMVLMTATGYRLSVWAVILMVARETIVSGFRLVAVTQGKVIAAGPSGKLKTVVQVFAVLLLTLNLQDLGYWVSWFAAALSVYSGAEIIVRNRSVLEETL